MLRSLVRYALSFLPDVSIEVGDAAPSEHAKIEAGIRMVEESIVRPADVFAPVASNKGPVARKTSEPIFPNQVWQFCDGHEKAGQRFIIKQSASKATGPWTVAHVGAPSFSIYTGDYILHSAFLVPVQPGQLWSLGGRDICIESPDSVDTWSVRYFAGRSFVTSESALLTHGTRVDGFGVTPTESAHDRSSCKPWCGHRSSSALYRMAHERITSGNAFAVDGTRPGERWCRTTCMDKKLPPFEPPKKAEPIKATHSYPVRCAHCGHRNGIEVEVRIAMASTKVAP